MKADFLQLHTATHWLSTHFQNCTSEAATELVAFLLHATSFKPSAEQTQLMVGRLTFRITTVHWLQGLSSFPGIRAEVKAFGLVRCSWTRSINSTRPWAAVRPELEGSALKRIRVELPLLLADPPAIGTALFSRHDVKPVWSSAAERIFRSVCYVVLEMPCPNRC